MLFPIFSKDVRKYFQDLFRKFTDRMGALTWSVVTGNTTYRVVNNGE